MALALTIPLCGVTIAALVTAGWLAIGAPGPAEATTWFAVRRVESSARYDGAPDRPFFFLALGNDGRTDADPGLGDAIHVIGVNPATREATIIDVPRDTTAPSGNKINAYHATGGLRSIVDQLNRMMGISISYAVTTNFPGLIDMVNEIGGIDVPVSAPMHDHDSGSDFDPGVYHMNGDQLLSFARDRKSFPVEGDRQRTVNQGVAIIAALATLRTQNPGAAGTARLVAILARHVRTEGLDLAELFRLGRLALSIDPANIRNVLVPTGAGGGTNLALTPAARDLFADFADDAVLQHH
jgi:LCP family protein required for cell wall assembly